MVLVIAATLLTSVPTLACGASGFDGHVFENDKLAFRVDHVPSEWRRIEADGVLLAFRDDEAPASIAVNGRCGKDGDDVPLRSLTHHLFLHFSEREVLEQRILPFDGREALLTDLRAKLDGVEKRYTVLVLKKDGCVYDFFHVAPASGSPDSRERFLAFARSFSTIKP